MASHEDSSDTVAPTGTRDHDRTTRVEIDESAAPDRMSPPMTAESPGMPCRKAPLGPAASERLARAFREQSEVLDLIAEPADLDDILERIALLAGRLLEPALCSIQVLDPEGGSLRHRATPGLPKRYVRAVGGVAFDGEASPWGLAMRRGERIAVADVESDPRWAAFAKVSLRHSLRACWSQPVRSPHDHLLGAITWHHLDACEPGPDDGVAMDAMASLTGLAISQDRRERQRRMTSERFASLAATIPGVVYQRLVTPDGDIRYTYISEGAQDLFGVSPEEIIADPQALFDCHGPEYRETFRERLLAASQELMMWDVEAQIITRNGEEKWSHAIARPHRQPDGSVLWDGVILDATWMKKAKTELRKAKEAAEASSRIHAELLARVRSADERFASLAATIPGVVYQRQVTPDGDIRYTYISEGAQDLFGVSSEEIIADPQALFDCHGPEYRATFRERLLAASRDLTMWDVEAQIITRNGEEKWTHAIARPHRQPDGSVLWDGVILDATWMKNAKTELRNAKEAAEASSQAKTNFLAQMSHELRTPLNVIIGFSDILISRPNIVNDNKKVNEYLKDINMSGARLLSMINDILEFADSEADNAEIFPGNVVLKKIIKDSIKQMLPFSKNSKVKITTRFKADIPILFADEKKIRRIVINLLSNAIKFTPHGGNVDIAAAVNRSGDVVVRITDTGIGIAMDQMPRLCEAFGKIDGDLYRKYEGTGLGVPLAIALARLHGGSITFDSRLGEGTTATLTLPKSRIVAAGGSAPPAAATAPTRG